MALQVVPRRPQSEDAGSPRSSDFVGWAPKLLTDGEVRSTAETEETSGDQFPKDIILRIACEVAVTDLVQMASVCRWWRTVINGSEGEVLWQELWNRRHGPHCVVNGYEGIGLPCSATPFCRPPLGWRHEFMAAFYLSRGRAFRKRRLAGHTSDVGNVRVCAERTKLVSTAPNSGELIVWDIKCGTPEVSFQVSNVYIVGETNNKKLILVSNSSPLSRFYSLDPIAGCLRELFAVNSSFLATGAPCLRLLSIVHGDKIVLARKDTNEVMVFDTEEGHCIGCFGGHNAMVEALTSTREGHIVTYSASGEIIWWNIPEGSILRRRISRVRVWGGRLTATTAGNLLAWGRGNVLWVLDAETGEPLRGVDCELEVHVGNIGIYATVDGQKVVLLFYPNPLIVDIPCGKVLADLEISRPSCATTSPDSSILLTGSEDGLIQMWLLQTGELLRSINTRAKVRSIWCAGDSVVAGLDTGDILVYTFSL
uniref:F-box domain-containing protein n=1 Tax=Compsopogon caeruleus TaxID=31354 RepID=A0A7S1TID1_9RHOD